MNRERRLYGNYVRKGAARVGVGSERWREAAELAAGQYGVVAKRQLAEAGIGAEVVAKWLQMKRLVRVHAGVYALGHRALRREGHLLAAVLACGLGALLSYRSAAALWGIRESSASRLDVTAPIRTGRKKPGLRVHCGERLAPDEITELEGIPCTTVGRTLLDLAAVLDPRGIAAAVESAERRGLLDLRDLSILLARHHGRRGTRRLRTVLAEFDPEVVRARSETEARLFYLCVGAGLPRPLVNRVIDAGGERFEVDLHWPAARLIVEVDSPFHDTTAARRRDPRRDAILGRSGWTVVRCRWADLLHHPERLIAQIRHHLSASGAFTDIVSGKAPLAG